VTVDPYVDPRTLTLRNRLGITDATVLARAEARLAAAAELVLVTERLDLGRYDLDHLRAIHRHLFGTVYDWAGELRTVNMTKGDTVFALVEWLEPQAAEVFDWLAVEDHLRARPRDLFIEGASRFLADLNALHPFREGNGRTQRAFLRLLAAEAGWHVAWSEVDPAENAAFSAAAMADRNAFVPLFHRIVRPLAGPTGPHP
jgi:cell filamentation protein, protein adenylyltransferase